MRPAPRTSPSPTGYRTILAAVLGAAALGAAAACADAPPPTAPAAVAAARAAAPAAGPPVARGAPSPDPRAVRRRLERAAAGLLYTSESDYPFDYVDLPAAADAPLTVAAFRTAAGVPADVDVEERTLDDFFARHIERVDPSDPAAVALVPRYRALRNALRTSVRGARVFRVGRVVVRCYVVGVDRRGHVVGLATTAVET
jgi:hypothetical protein